MRLRLAAVALFSAVSVPSVAVDFGVAGPETVETRAAVTVEVEGRALTSEVWFPAAPGPRPGIALSHGFVSDRFTVASVGRHLASWGFVVVAPNLPAPWAPDAELNARLARAIVDTWLPARSADPSSYLADRLFPARSGVVGHSAGGLSSLLALKDAPVGTRAAGVLLDWVDSAANPWTEPPARGANALPSVWAPAAFLFAEPHACNELGNGVGASRLATGPRLQLRVVGASHCDPGDPVAIGCRSSCGGFDEDRAALFLGYGTAWLRRFLLEDPDAAAWLGGPAMERHLSDGEVADVELVRVPSLETADAGVVEEGVDAAVPDAGNVEEMADSGVSIDAGEGPVEVTDAGEPEAPPEGCGCGASASTMLVPLVPLLRRRRSA